MSHKPPTHPESNQTSQYDSTDSHSVNSALSLYSLEIKCSLISLIYNLFTCFKISKYSNWQVTCEGLLKAPYKNWLAPIWTAEFNTIGNTSP